MLIKTILAVSLFFLAGSVTSCNKSGCPANQSLYNESMGGPVKKSKPPKTSSGMFPPEGRKGKKY